MRNKTNICSMWNFLRGNTVPDPYTNGFVYRWKQGFVIALQRLKKKGSSWTLARQLTQYFWVWLTSCKTLTRYCRKHSWVLLTTIHIKRTVSNLSSYLIREKCTTAFCTLSIFVNIIRLLYFFASDNYFESLDFGLYSTLNFVQKAFFSYPNVKYARSSDQLDND